MGKDPDQPLPSSRDGPYLLQVNRRLRNLKAISIRNITFEPTQYRFTAGIPNEVTPEMRHAFFDSRYDAMQEYKKMVREDAKAQGKVLKQDFSSTRPVVRQLRPLDLDENGNPRKGIMSLADYPLGARVRPTITMKHRRSTFNWNESSDARQQVLESSIKPRLPDTFIQIYNHMPSALDASDELYNDSIMNSSICYESSNVDYDIVDLPTQEAKKHVRGHKMWWSDPDHGELGRLLDFTVLVYASRDHENFERLFTLEVHAEFLVWIGKKLEDYPYQFPDNCIIFHFTDGIYVNPYDFPQDKPRVYMGSMIHTPIASQPSNTSSLNSLHQVATINACIEDARKTFNDALAEYDSKYHNSTNDSLMHQNMQTEAETAHNQMKATEKALEELRKTNAATQVQLVQKMIANAERRKNIKLKAQAGQLRHLPPGIELNFLQVVKELVKEDLPEPDKKILREHMTQFWTAEVTAQRKLQIAEIIRRVITIWPIVPVPDKPLNFTIRGIWLPNAEHFLENENPSQDEQTATAAVVGWVVRLVLYLNQMNCVPLPYPLHELGSNCSALDVLTPAHKIARVPPAQKLRPKELPTFENSPHRVYPLYQKGSKPADFRWGMFMLNQDLKVLCESAGIKIIDPRKTLANLKLLMETLVSPLAVHKRLNPETKVRATSSLVTVSAEEAELKDRAKNLALLSFQRFGVHTVRPGDNLIAPGGNGSPSYTATTFHETDSDILMPKPGAVSTGLVAESNVANYKNVGTTPEAPANAKAMVEILKNYDMMTFEEKKQAFLEAISTSASKDDKTTDEVMRSALFHMMSRMEERGEMKPVVGKEGDRKAPVAINGDKGGEGKEDKAKGREDEGKGPDGGSIERFLQVE